MNQNFKSEQAHQNYLTYQRDYYQKNKHYFKARDLITGIVSPEKIKARRFSKQMFKKLPKGFERHHFSYNECDWGNIIILSKSEHRRVHEALKYDNETKYFYYHNELLDNFQSHYKAVREILDNKIEFYEQF